MRGRELDAELDAVLTAQPSVRVERPDLLWEPVTDRQSFRTLLAEMIAAGLARRRDPSSPVVINVSNVTVAPEAAGDPGEDRTTPVGDFVAVTVHSIGDWDPETVWQPGADAAVPLVSADLETAAAAAGAPFGYSRVLGDGAGSVTVFLRRATA